MMMVETTHSLYSVCVVSKDLSLRERESTKVAEGALINCVLSKRGSFPRSNANTTTTVQCTHKRYAEATWPRARESIFHNSHSNVKNSE